MGEHMHRGQKVQSIAAAVHARLAACVQDCRVRERLSDDHARYDVTPRRSDALPFSIEIAPGGINLDGTIFTLNDLALEQEDFAIAIVEAILDGRVRQVTRLNASGKMLASKAILRDATGRTLFKGRRAPSPISLLFSRRGKAVRKAYAAYRG